MLYFIFLSSNSDKLVVSPLLSAWVQYYYTMGANARERRNVNNTDLQGLRVRAASYELPNQLCPRATIVSTNKVNV